MITAEVKNSGLPYVGFPKLMVSNFGNIVLFSAPRVGTVLSGTKEYTHGYISSSWDMDAFADFTGSVTLSNGG